MVFIPTSAEAAPHFAPIIYNDSSFCINFDPRTAEADCEHRTLPVYQ